MVRNGASGSNVGHPLPESGWLDDFHQFRELQRRGRQSQAYIVKFSEETAPESQWNMTPKYLGYPQTLNPYLYLLTVYPSATVKVHGLSNRGHGAEWTTSTVCKMRVSWQLAREKQCGAWARKRKPTS